MSCRRYVGSYDPDTTHALTISNPKQNKQYLEDGPPLKYDKETKRFASPRTGSVLPEPLAAKLFFGLVSGLQYLHGKRVCHRDIKVRGWVMGWLVGGGHWLVE